MLRGLYIGNPQIDLTGRRFGFVTVLRYAGSKAHQPRWDCKCDCGKVKQLRGNHLLHGLTQSCGCQNERFKKGSTSGSWKGVGQVTGSCFAFLRAAARVRNLEVAVSVSDLWELFQGQKGLCALTGLPISLGKSARDGIRGTASVDRIDSKLGYTKQNIQWVHKDINRMKSNFEQGYFVKLCKMVVTREESNAGRN